MQKVLFKYHSSSWTHYPDSETRWWQRDAGVRLFFSTSRERDQSRCEDGWNWLQDKPVERYIRDKGSRTTTQTYRQRYYGMVQIRKAYSCGTMAQSKSRIWYKSWKSIDTHHPVKTSSCNRSRRWFCTPHFSELWNWFIILLPLCTHAQFGVGLLPSKFQQDMRVCWAWHHYFSQGFPTAEHSNLAYFYKIWHMLEAQEEIWTLFLTSL